jgi:hypothetical protein
VAWHWNVATEFLILGLLISLSALSKVAFDFAINSAMHLPEHLAAIVDSLDEHHTKIAMSVYDDLHPPIEDPVGLALTLSTVIASWYNPSGSIEVMKEPITPMFKTHYEKTLHDYDAILRKTVISPFLNRIWTI